MVFRSLLAWMLVGAAVAASTEHDAAPVLFTPADRLAIRSGKLVARVIDTGDRTEVLSVAAMRTALDLDRLLECAESPLGVRRPEDSLGEGRLGSPPRPSDFAALRLDERDVQSLSECRVGDCRVRLTGDAIARLSGVDWSATTRTRDAERAMRAILADEAAAYLAHGNAGLAAYEDGPNSVHRAEGLGELLGRPFYLLDGANDLADYLRFFPSARPRLRDEFLSWRQERFWRRPLLGLYHTMVWEASSPGERRIIVASKQFYASHFYESAVDVVEFRQRTDEGEVDLTFVARVRADIRPAGFTWLERTLLRRLVRGRLEDQFESLDARLKEPPLVRKAAGP